MNVPETLRQIMAAANVKQAGLADLIGVTQGQVSRLMKGAQPYKETYDSIRDAAIRYGVPVDEDLRSEDVAAQIESRPRRQIKVKGYVGAGGAAHYYDVGETHLDEIDASDKDPPGAVAVEIKGTSLGRFFDRWYAIYDEVREPITEDMIGPGKLCIVGLDDDRILIKEVRRNGNRFDLLSNDNDEPPIVGVRIKWAARVISIRAKS